MTNKVITKAVRIVLSNEECKVIEQLGEKYYTSKLNQIIKNIVRDEIKDFEEENKEGIYVVYQEVTEADQEKVVCFDEYTLRIIQNYSKKMNVTTRWFVEYLLRKKIKSVQQKGAV